MKKIVCTLIILTLTVIISKDAFARIDMLPFRIVMETRDRSGEVMVLNLSNETRAFRTSIINYRQSAKGSYQKLEEPLNPLFDPKEIVRMSPQSFTLGPNGKQRVRIALRKPADLPEGEYRFHFTATSYATNGERNEDSDNILVRMAMNVGIAIPIIIRQGDLSVESKLQDFELVGGNETNNNTPQLNFTATREGNRSTIGKITVEWASNGGNYEEIGRLLNFNIFPEIDRRSGSVPLDKLPSQGSLRVVYEDEVTNETYDEIIFDL